jgi:4-hydroxybenzoate polyprenyltransferase/phosphoserine phosphatase
MPFLSEDAAASQRSMNSALFVDLDGTLIYGDLLHESAAKLLFRRPLWLLVTFIRLGSHPATFKQVISEAISPHAATLPYRQQILQLIEKRRNASRIVLATAGHRSWAELVADHLGVFDDVLASDGITNLKGTHKLEAIRTWCARHNMHSWGYVGDSTSDIAIWRSADEAVAVGASKHFQSRLISVRPDMKFIGSNPSPVGVLARVLRLQQWVKNLLVLTPIPLSQMPPTWHMLAAGMLAMLAFCLAASGVYVVNDLLDLDSDRKHPKKRARPFAAGRVPILVGPPLAFGAFLAAAGLAYVIGSGAFGVWLGLYMLLTTAYSLRLKRVPILDVVLLAFLYMSRILAGGAATGVPISEWLIAFSMFFFLSLAFVKRHSELLRLKATTESSAAGRGYVANDAPVVQALGTASGLISVLVFALFAHSPETRQLYANSAALWCVCPLLTLWLGRIWLYSARGSLGEDPVMFAVKDPLSIATGGLVLACVLCARGFVFW